MSILKNRAVASLITAVTMVVSTAISGTVGLNAKCREVEDAFYTGVYSSAEGYMLKSISSQLDVRIAMANGICSIANKYPELEAKSKALSEARTKLIDATTISGKYKANLALHEAYNDLVAGLSTVDTSADQKSLEHYMSYFENAQRLIDQSGYNEYVRDFTRNTLNAFPGGLFMALTDIDAPDLFS